MSLGIKIMLLPVKSGYLFLLMHRLLGLKLLQCLGQSETLDPRDESFLYTERIKFFEEVRAGVIEKCVCCVYMQAGFVAAVPYLVMAVTVQVGGQLADFVRTRHLLNTTNTRKVFNCTGKMLVLGLCCTGVHEISHLFYCVAEYTVSLNFNL